MKTKRPNIFIFITFIKHIHFQQHMAMKDATETCFGKNDTRRRSYVA